MEASKFQIKQRPFSSIFTFRIEHSENGSLMATVLQKDADGANSTALHRFHHQYHHVARVQDDVGALYYVVAVILIYGCSILMMIASYIRKNKVDRRLNRYLKEMANVRKRERRMTLMTATAKVAKKDGLVLAESGVDTPIPSPNASPSCLGSTASALDVTGQLSSTADVTSVEDRCRHATTRSKEVRHSSLHRIQQQTGKSASYQFLAVDPPSRQGARRLSGGPSRGGCNVCPPRASSPVLVISKHHGDDVDDDEYNGDSDCSAHGGAGSDPSNSAIDLHTSGLSLNIPPAWVHPSATRRYRQTTVNGAGKRRKSVTLCVPGSPRYPGHAVLVCSTTEAAESGCVTLSQTIYSEQPGTPTSIAEPEVDVVDAPTSDVVVRRVIDDASGCPMLVSSV